MQDYLKAVLALRRGGPVTIHQLATRLGISSPSVTNMVGRLTALGYLEHARYGDVTLSGAGERAARAVARNHRLIERYLMQALDYPRDLAHAEAEHLEHYISPDLERRLARRVEESRRPRGYPGVEE